MPEDVALIDELGANAYRFSIEWSRVEPAAGEWSEQAWARYQDLVLRLLVKDHPRRPPPYLW
jgi:beta-glucosidase